MQTQQTFLSKYKSLIILALDFVFMLVLIKILPFSAQENRGLALLIFIGILWLTEAFNITVTSLMVPVVAIGLGLINTNMKTKSKERIRRLLYLERKVC